jgi:NTP pyrophosphatase (non-canonical NTP hydrolase)
MPNDRLTLAAFQKHVSGRYEAADRARGWAKTFAFFIEEVGELATALSTEGKDPENLKEEFADVLAWLCTLANISDVDLSEAVAAKYLGERPPEGTK